MELIDWNCDTCHQPTRGSGAISIPYEAIRTANSDRKAVADGRSAFAGATVMDALDMTNLGIWKVECNSCAGECLFSYWIDLSRASTPAELSWWTDHLSSKTWLAGTNWSAIVASVGIKHPVRAAV